MLSDTRVSLFVTSLALLGTVATLANSWVLLSSCLDYHQSFCYIYLSVGHKGGVYHIEASCSALKYGRTSAAASFPSYNID